MAAIALGASAAGIGASALWLRSRVHGVTPGDPAGPRRPARVEEPAFLREAGLVAGAPTVHGNRVEVLINGTEIFPAMLGAIRGATSSVNLLTYVWWEGDVCWEIAQAVADRAGDGVDCDVLIDGFGGRRMEESVRRTMVDAGVRVAVFRPIRPGTTGRLSHRTHRRALVVDGRIGFTGGVGIADEWCGDAEDPDHWRETHCRIAGPAAAGLQRAFAENWLEATGHVPLGEEHLPPIAPDGDVAVQVVGSRPGLGATDAGALLTLAVAAARSTVDITAGYFGPPDPFLKAVREATERGVRVRLVVAGEHPEAAVVRDLGRASYGALLDAGVEIHEYDRTVLHAKTMSVDGAWSVIGTTNLDARSMAHNDEIMACIQDASVARRLTDQFEQDLEACRTIDAERWSRRPIRQRLRERAATSVRHLV